MSNQSNQHLYLPGALQKSRLNARLNPLSHVSINRSQLQGMGENSDVDSRVVPNGAPKIPKGYELADYTKAIDYRDSQSYTRKSIGPGGQPEYIPYQTCVDTSELKKYGLGVYMYLEFVKRLGVTLLIMSAINIVPIVYSFQNGKAMDSYTKSYMIYLAQTSLGNIGNGDRITYMIFTVCDILSMLVLFFFYLHWRSFHNETVQEEEKDHTIVNPTTYVLSVIGFDKATPNLQANLKKYFEDVFGGAHEVEVVYNYGGNFSKFISYDEIIEKQQKQKFVISQTNKGKQDLDEIQKQITQFQGQLSLLSQTFEPQYAIIHFKTLRSKLKFVNFCRKFNMFDKLSDQFIKFICCQANPPANQLFMGNTPLIIKSMNLSRPEQINWQNLDISVCSRFFRSVFSILFLVIAILITTSLIALCTLYVSSTSACSNYDATTLLPAAQSAGGQTLYCYCAAHFSDIYTNVLIEKACSSLSNSILYANLMQIGASLVSAVSNVLLVVVVGVIAKYLLKPDSKPKQYSFIFMGVLISNYINASVLPLVMNGDIFGFQSLQYLTFINFIDFNKVAVFKDYDTDWYAVVAPYYMNFLIIAITSPFINLLITCFSNCLTLWGVKSSCQSPDKSNPLIQKQADVKLTSTMFQISIQQAIVFLHFSICIMYSSLIPVLLPITTIIMLSTFLCKKAIILKYSVKVPADHSLSQKTITLIPFVILLHFLMGVWSHTAQGVFSNTAYIVEFSMDVLSTKFNRVFLDILMLGGVALILVWLVFDYTIISFFGFISDCFCKKDIQIPVQFSKIQNIAFKERSQYSNILGSYKLINNPMFGHAIKAYKQLIKRVKKQNTRLSQTNQLNFAGRTQSNLKTSSNFTPQKQLFSTNIMNDKLNPEMQN